RILAWVEQCLQQLEPHTERRLLAGVPLASLRRLSPAVFAMFRHVLVPSCRLSLREGLEQAERLHEGLQRLAETRGATFVAPDDGWYGADPIHIRRAKWPLAASALLGLPGECAGPAPRADTFARR